jgi:hypothetical protein
MYGLKPVPFWGSVCESHYEFSPRPELVQLSIRD